MTPFEYIIILYASSVGFFISIVVISWPVNLLIVYAVWASVEVHYQPHRMPHCCLVSQLDIPLLWNVRISEFVKFKEAGKGWSKNHTTYSVYQQLIL